MEIVKLAYYRNSSKLFSAKVILLYDSYSHSGFVFSISSTNKGVKMRVHPQVAKLLGSR